MSSTDFAELARRYCSLIEGAGRSDPRRFLARVEEVLSRTYAVAAALPDLEPDTHLSPAELVTTDEWQGRFEDLKVVLGANEAGLADALVVVYRELAEGLQLLHSGSPPEEVLGHWRVSFRDRWAGSASAALRALRAAPAS